MQTIDLSSWEEFENRLKELEQERESSTTPFRFLFRGQEDHTFHLSTTLERSGKEKISLREYHHLITNVKPQIESFTGLSWNIIPYPEGIEKWLTNYDTWISSAFERPDFQETYSYMIYLRHHGFPSPLLDWTASQYVAAYFAFRKTQNSEYASIYIYLESNAKGGMKNEDAGEPNILVFGPYVKSDRRHFLQQSQYTICLTPDQQNQSSDRWRYASHEDVLERNEQGQNLLWKFNIPCSERLKVLKLLERYNINALSLFGSEESLMETMALREIELREREL